MSIIVDLSPVYIFTLLFEARSSRIVCRSLLLLQSVPELPVLEVRNIINTLHLTLDDIDRGRVCRFFAISSSVSPDQQSSQTKRKYTLRNSAR